MQTALCRLHQHFLMKSAFPLIESIAYDPRWHPDDNCIGWNIPGHNRAGTDNSPVADRDPAQQNSPVSDQHIVANRRDARRWSTGKNDRHTWSVEIVVGPDDRHAGGKRGVVADMDPRGQLAMGTDVDIVPSDQPRADADRLAYMEASADAGSSVSKSNENPRSGSLEQSLASTPDEMPPLTAVGSSPEQHGRRQLLDGWDCTVHESPSHTTRPSKSWRPREKQLIRSCSQGRSHLHADRKTL